MKTDPDKARAWQQRSAQRYRERRRERSEAPKWSRRNSLPKTNPKRVAATRKEDYAEQAQLCRELPCAIWEVAGRRCRGRTVPHHEPPRSCGGTDKDCLPLCVWHHDLRHSMGVHSFWKAHGIDPAAVKQRVQELLARGGVAA